MTALWREGLLALRVLEGRTKGYVNHPQLERFRRTKNPVAAINAFLHEVLDEARSRDYHFDGSKLSARNYRGRITVTTGQLEYELKHLKRKLRTRSPADYRRLLKLKSPPAHPIFRVVKGPVADWEKTDR